MGYRKAMKAVLHDLDAQYDEMIASKCDHAIPADGKYAPCQGCFGCWPKHPAECKVKAPPAWTALMFHFLQCASMARCANAAVPSPPCLSMFAVKSPPPAYIKPSPRRVSSEQV